MRRIALVVAVVALAVGINRIVVTDGRIDATLGAFKSDYFPLERASRHSTQEESP